MANFKTVAPGEVLAKTSRALEANGFTVQVVTSGKDAKAKALELLPKGAEVLTVTSQTVNDIGLAAAINESGDYDAVRPKLAQLMGDPSKKREQRKLGAAPDFVVGSVHAITEDGTVLIASATGSQLSPDVYGAGHVIWIVGAQKIVGDWEAAMARLQEHVFPLEDARALKAYGGHSSINKVVRFNKEAAPGRIDIILVQEALGF
ncbi:MAG TPA: LUD domain-containing protein [Candidatus Saccharimonadales bacterium]|nr:LUD domain-containing protein [Candidatus Saccharimonadales bacterium]